MVRLFLIFTSVFGAVLLAQAPVVRGRVVHAGTGDAIAKAVVRATTKIGGEEYHAIERTDGDGRFQLQGIVPADYLIGAEKAGFLPRLFGPEEPGAPPQYLAVKAGDVHDIVLRLRPMTAIRGRVVDETGEGVNMAQLQLLARGFERGKPAWQVVREFGADGQGQFRFEGLMPGRYVLAAMGLHGMKGGLPSDIDVSLKPVERQYAPAFYGGGREPSEAKLMEVRAGQVLEGIELALLPMETGSIEMTVSGLPSENSYPNLSAMTESEWVLQRRNMTWDAQKRVARLYEPVLPGRYHVVGHLEHEGRVYAANAVVDVPAGGVARAELTFAPAIDLEGRVRVEGPGAEKFRDVKVTLLPGSVRQPIASELEARPDKEGRFVIRNVPPGVWDIGVEPIPAGGYLKSMTLGGADVLTKDMVIDAASRGPLNVVVSTRGGVVKGSVEMEDKRTVATVLLLPEGEFAHVISFHQGAETEPGGGFEMRGVTPGRYRVYAFNQIAPWEWLQDGFLDQYREMGTAVEIGEEQTVEANTKLIRRGR
ncbi:MAG: carboxypeptidase-like regulatory domain-containing protein [Bryobacteraceae bacterium]|nr:carboxypeptidase-like regulatory domain-containing protein [Bryobacteraceae bacterium]